MAKTIFLDRDGVFLKEPVFDPTIGSASEAVNTWERFEILPTVASAFKKLKGKGYQIYMVTNQEAIDEGSLPQEFYNATNKRIVEFLAEHDGAPIDGIYTCAHPVNSGCGCRKPARGLIDQILRDHPEVDTSKSWFIGNRTTDINLGMLIGARTVFLPMNHKLEPDIVPETVAKDLEEAVDYVLSH